MQLDPCLNLAGHEGLKVLINSNQASFDIISRAELARQGNEIVDQDKMLRYFPRLLFPRE